VGEQQLLAPPEKFPKHRLPVLCGEIAGISFIPGCVSNPRLFIRALTPGFWRLYGKMLVARLQRLPSHIFFLRYGA